MIVFYKCWCWKGRDKFPKRWHLHRKTRFTFLYWLGRILERYVSERSGHHRRDHLLGKGMEHERFRIWKKENKK